LKAHISPNPNPNINLQGWDWKLKGDKTTYHALYPRAWTVYEEPHPGIQFFLFSPLSFLFLVVYYYSSLILRLFCGLILRTDSLVFSFFLFLVLLLSCRFVFSSRFICFLLASFSFFLLRFLSSCFVFFLLASFSFFLICFFLLTLFSLKEFRYTFGMQTDYTSYTK
jgi:beta-glucosidase 2, glycosyl-hydrolase family 116 N-term